MLNLFVWLRGQTMRLTPTFIIEPEIPGGIFMPQRRWQSKDVGVIKNYLNNWESISISDKI